MMLSLKYDVEMCIFIYIGSFVCFMNLVSFYVLLRIRKLCFGLEDVVYSLYISFCRNIREIEKG